MCPLPQHYYFLSQPQDSSCFVMAVANACVFKGLTVRYLTRPNIEEAKDIACCRNGSTIHHLEVVDYFRAPLIPTSDIDQVFIFGGIVNIMHPIFNGHSFFLYPEDGGFTLVNSWLGPNVVRGIGKNEVLKFVVPNLGKYWHLA